MKRTLFEGKYLRLLDHNSWEYVERKNCTGIVIILAVTEKDKVILIEQIRVPVGKRVIEFPAGLVNDRYVERKRGQVQKQENVPVPFSKEKRETLKEAAFREFLEETGYQAKKMILLTNGPINSGISSSAVTFFQAQGLKKIHGGGGDHTEAITVYEVPLKEVDTWLQKMQKKGRAVDPKVYAGLYFLKKVKF